MLEQVPLCQWVSEVAYVFATVVCCDAIGSNHKCFSAAVQVIYAHMHHPNLSLGAG